jgi:peptide subunit release factor 1 (eRF1)
MYDQQRLQEIGLLPSPVLTVYLNTANQDPSLHPVVPACLRWFTDEAEALSRTLLPRDGKRFKEPVDRFERFLSLRRPQEKALAAFMGPDIWEVLPLHICLENQLRWGKPSVSQLFRLLSEHRPYGVVVVDHHGARFFRSHLGELTTIAEKHYEVDESQWKRTDVAHIGAERTRKAHGADRDLFDHRLRVQFEHLCAETANQLLALSKKNDFAGLFLVGSHRLIDPIQKRLPPAASGLVVSVSEDMGGFSPTEILRRLEPLVADYERKRQLAEVHHVMTADSRTIRDVDETLARLQRGTIGTVLLASDHDFHVRECAKCGLVSRASDIACADCGGERRRIPLLDVLPRLSTEYGVKVEFVRGEAAQVLAKAGGIGGWLRQSKKSAAG